MEKTKRNYSLDFLKILATIGIVFHHFQQITNAKYDGFINFWGEWFYWGYLVELFFLLSGYFMYRYIPSILEGAVTLADWWKKRALRLLPWVAISAIGYECILFAYLKINGSDWFDISITIWGTVIASLGIQEGWVFSNPSVNNPIWYISVLMACYIVFYIITALASKIKCKPTYFYITMILLGIGVGTYNINLPFLNLQMGRGYYAFFFGLLLSAYINKHGVKLKEVIASVLCLSFFTFVFIYYPNYGASNLNYTLTFLVFPSLIVIFESKLMQRIFCQKIWGTLSAISFEVYLWHNPMFPLMYVVIKLLNRTPDFSKISSMFIFLLASWVVGALMYFLVERPVTKLLAKKPKISTADKNMR